MLANVVVVEKGWVGGRGFAVGFGDREAMFVRGEKVPVASNEEGTMQRVGEGEFNINEHLGGYRADKGGGEILVVDVPGNRGWLGEGGETETESAARNGEGVINMEVGKKGGGGLTDKDGDTSFSGIVGEGGEEVEVDKDGTQDKTKRFFGTMNFLEKHDVNGEKKFVEVTNFGFLASGVVVEKGAAIPSSDTNGLGRERVRN